MDSDTSGVEMFGADEHQTYSGEIKQLDLVIVGPLELHYSHLAV